MSQGVELKDMDRGSVCGRDARFRSWRLRGIDGVRDRRLFRRGPRLRRVHVGRQGTRLSRSWKWMGLSWDVRNLGVCTSRRLHGYSSTR